MSSCLSWKPFISTYMTVNGIFHVSILGLAMYCLAFICWMRDHWSGLVIVEYEINDSALDLTFSKSKCSWSNLLNYILLGILLLPFWDCLTMLACCLVFDTHHYLPALWAWRLVWLPTKRSLLSVNMWPLLFFGFAYLYVLFFLFCYAVLVFLWNLTSDNEMWPFALRWYKGIQSSNGWVPSCFHCFLGAWKRVTTFSYESIFPRKL